MRSIAGGILVLLLVVLLLPPMNVSAQARAGNRDYTERSQRTSDAPSVVDHRAALRAAIASGRAVRVVVQLSDRPLANFEGGRGMGATRPARGQKLNLRSANAETYSRFLADRRGAFIAWARSNAPGARVEREFRIAVNGVALRAGGADLAALLRAPGVKSVTLARPFRLTMNISRGLIGTPALDASLGSALPGAGMRVGIIDTGIANTHVFFDPTGYTAPAGFPVADNAANLACCTSAKVIVARSYPDPAIGGPDSAVDTNSHGSHVGGTVAGNTGNTASVQGVAIPGMSGLAHRAFLGNYNVFPNGQVEAFDPEIIAAIEDAIADGMDVINESLGGPVCCLEDADPLASANNAAADAGVVPAIAAGNSGPGLFSVSSPGIASKAITAAASTNPHFVGQPVSGVMAIGTVGGAAGDFNTYPTVTQSWQSFGTNLACAPAVPAPTADPQIAVISRGACTFTTKIRNAENAGYDGVLVQNNVAGDPVAMGHDGTDPFPTIPAVMIQKGALAGTTGTAEITGTFTEVISSSNLTPDGATPNADIIAGFSSRGPVPIDFRLKPDVSAPGVNVLSAINEVAPPGWAFFQGTSMATPHMAGSAALMKQLHPTWGPADIKSALVTRAKRPVFDHVNAATDTDPRVRGGGRVNLALSKDANAVFNPSVVSFGEVATSVEVMITLKNVNSGTNTWSISVEEFKDSCGPTLPIVPSTASTGPVASGASTTFDVTATNPGYAATCMGDIVVSDGAQTHRLPFLARLGTSK